MTCLSAPILASDESNVTVLGDRGHAYAGLNNAALALADLNRAIDLQPDYDWHRYLRALIYLREGNQKEAHSDLNVAIEAASGKYKEDPRRWRNAFNLALYYLAADQPDQALRLANEGISSGASEIRMREAIEDLIDFLILLPKHRDALTLKQVYETAVTSGSI